MGVAVGSDAGVVVGDGVDVATGSDTDVGGGTGDATGSGTEICGSLCPAQPLMKIYPPRRMSSAYGFIFPPSPWAVPTLRSAQRVLADAL